MFYRLGSCAYLVALAFASCDGRSIDSGNQRNANALASSKNPSSQQNSYAQRVLVQFGFFLCVTLRSLRLGGELGRKLNTACAEIAELHRVLKTAPLSAQPANFQTST